MGDVLCDMSWLKKENCERFFEVSGASFLFASIYSEVYKDIGIMILNKQGHVSVNFIKKGANQSRKDGALFFSNQKSFEEYSKDFIFFLINGNEYFESIIDKKKINENDIKLFFDIVLKFYSFYRKTEFIYTDSIYTQQKKSAIVKKNLKKIEKLKTKGRKLLIEIFNGQNCYLNKLLNKINTKTKLDINKLSLYGYQELLSIFSQTISKSKLESRKINYILSHFNNEELFLKNKKFIEICKTYCTITSDIIAGTVANKGLVIGIAYVIDANFKNFDYLISIIHEMKKGEILITETTSPDLILACKKASAIITNQGGLGSHAAIVSRELSIPCIVGTQNATKKIKTGDKLLVDANNGKIKILSYDIQQLS